MNNDAKYRPLPIRLANAVGSLVTSAGWTRGKQHADRLMVRVFIVRALLGAFLGLAVAGCSSVSGPGSASFASVTIQNQSAEKIANATANVFSADGYVGGMTGQGRMVFDKEASRGTSFAREGFADGFYGAQTLHRVRVEIVPLADGSFRLQCKAYMVTGGSDPFFQDEVPLANIRSGPYQSLLNKVAKDLK